MKFLPAALLTATAFALGSVLTTALSVSGARIPLYAGVALFVSAVALVAWFFVARRPLPAPPPRRIALVICASLNVVLAGGLAYTLLGIRAQELYLASRYEAALSLLGPRFLPPGHVFLYSASFTPADGFRVSCPGYRPGLTPTYIGRSIILEPYDVVGASLSFDSGLGHSPSVAVALRDSGLLRLRQYSQSHVGQAVAFVVDDVTLYVGLIGSPIEASPFVLGGLGFSESEARRLVFWLRRRK